MKMPTDDVIKDVKSIKESAGANTSFGEFDEASAELERAIKNLRRELDDIEWQSTISLELKEKRCYKLAYQLADCYGMAGGVYRRRAKSNKSYYDISIQMYNEGKEIEKAYRIQSSYNLINSIVVSILQDANRLLEKQGDIYEAIDIVQKQVEVSRRNEWWAWADLGQLYLLSGKDREAHQSYERFIKTGARAKDFVSTIQVLDELKQVLEASSPLISELIAKEIKFLSANKPSR